ncbi:cysteine-rich receptor-like protein kinase 10 [Typha angustifolia]|uniref:cysteine-rich receptor-like protein kinase 10 n=1 Tax=Typha angustifolia TaxID=59011 RepID=UPI003C2BC7E2
MALPLFSNLQTQLLLVLLFIILLHAPTTNSQAPDSHYYTTCETAENYTASSIYKTNLDLLLSSLYSAASVSGFSNDTIGKIPDQVYGLSLCRGDLSLYECQKCLKTAMQDVVVDCPRGKNAQIWRHYCSLRYANENFLGLDEGYYVYQGSGTNATDPELFNDRLGNLIGSLTTKAAYSSLLMFAAGSANYTSFYPIYGLVQCTRDLSNGGCNRCLSSLRSEIPKCCGGHDGAKLYGRNCIIRYELHPFYNDTAVNELSSPPPPPTPSPHAATPPPPTPPPSKNDSIVNPARTNGTTKTILIIVIAVVAVFSLILATLLFICFRRRKAVRTIARNGRDNQQDIVTSEAQLFDLDTLKAATNGFSDANKLGEGGFGPVYKGILLGGQEIAVKRLSWTSRQGLVELRNEVVLVAKLQHRNLVRLLGFCLEEKEKLLVYEYLPHKSLDTILFDSCRRGKLDWGSRYKIIEGIGRGLLYLHKDSCLKIVHRDLKASNILLDGDMNPKISDFGLAKLVNVDETQWNTSRIAGTYGYMAPEYALHGIFSTKSDVFSYGVIVLEILTGQRNNSYQESGQLVDLLRYVWQHWIEGKAFEIIDKSLDTHCQSEGVLRCIHISLLCVQEEPSERPTMSSVILMLSSSSISLPTPKPPSSLLRGGIISESNILETETSIDFPRTERSIGGAR